MIERQLFRQAAGAQDSLVDMFSDSYADGTDPDNEDGPDAAASGTSLLHATSHDNFNGTFGMNFLNGIGYQDVLHDSLYADIMEASEEEEASEDGGFIIAVIAIFGTIFALIIIRVLCCVMSNLWNSAAGRRMDEGLAQYCPGSNCADDSW